MKQPLYRVVFATAWEITKKHRFLWLFGLFASLITARIFPPLINNFYYLQDKAFILKKLSLLDPQTLKSALAWTNFQNLDVYASSTYLLIGALAILLIFAIWITITSLICLVLGTDSYYKNNKKKLDFLKLIEKSQKHFWEILALNIFIKIILLGVFILLTLPIFYFWLNNQIYWQIGFSIIFFLAFTILELIAGFVIIFSANHIILDNLDIFSSIKRAWKLFRKNWLISLETAIILFALQVLILAISITAVIIISLPFLLIFYIAILSNFLALAILALALGILAAYLAILLFNAVFSTFYISSWTIMFIKLTQESPLAKLIRLEYRITNYFKKRARKKLAKKK